MATTAKDFILGLPAKAKPETLQGLETKFHFDISGDGGGAFTVNIADGAMIATEGHEGEAKCTVKATAENFMGTLRGDINPMMAVLTGKIKISNQGEMMKYAKIFGLM